jgi:hypothetical protein
MKPPALTKEESMEPTESSKSIENDVLHLGSQTKLSPEEIAKALAHHKNKHHTGDQPQSAPAKNASGKKHK